MDPDPAIFVTDRQQKTKNFKKVLLLLPYFFKGHLHRFTKIKNPKEVTKQ
jgi:hypothetical protein